VGALHQGNTKRCARERKTTAHPIKIDPSKLEEGTSKSIDLTNESEREKYDSGVTQINRVKSSKEIFIPSQNSRGENVFEEWKNPPKPEKPK
jgi:hypothetical protein